MTGINSIASNQKALVSDSPYLGYVVDNNDPTKKQRVRVSIPGKLEAESIEDLPWCAPYHHSFFGIGDDYGVMRVPRIGARVRVRFQQGDLSHGEYISDAVTVNTELPQELLDNYPNRTGSCTPKGDILYVDHVSGEFFYRHHSGTGVTIDDGGNLVLFVKGNFTQVVEGDYALSVKGKRQISIEGDDARHVGGDNSLHTDGDHREVIGGDISSTTAGRRSVSCASESHSGPSDMAGRFTSQGVSLPDHNHGGVDRGTSNTNPPN